MKKIAQLMLSSVLLSLLVGCSKQNNKEFNPEVISGEQPISQTQLDSNEQPLNPDYVGVVKSLTFSEHKQ